MPVSASMASAAPSPITSASCGTDVSGSSGRSTIEP